MNKVGRFKEEKLERRRGREGRLAGRDKKRHKKRRTGGDRRGGRDRGM